MFASIRSDLLQESNLFEKVAGVFGFLAHFAVRSFELFGRNTRCVCEHSQRFVQEPKLFEKGEGVFTFLAHFAVRSLELLAGNTRCVFEHSKRFVASTKNAEYRMRTLCVSLHTSQ